VDTVSDGSESTFFCRVLYTVPGSRKYAIRDTPTCVSDLDTMGSVDFLDLDTIGSVDSEPMLNPDLDPGRPNLPVKRYE